VVRLRPLRQQVAPSAAARATIAERHGLAALTPAGNGPHVVWWNATGAVKLFLPLYPTDGPREARVARALAGRLPVSPPSSGPTWQGPDWTRTTRGSVTR
jgi:hypothetical protein